MDFLDWQLYNPTEFMTSFNTPMHEILPANTEPDAGQSGALYLGSITALKEPQDLLDKGIICVLGLVMLDIYPLANDPRFETMVISMHDMDDQGAELRRQLPVLCNWIKTALARNQPVLVHCHAGMSRSASVVIAYLIREQGMSYDEAAQFVWARRKCIAPNPGFVEALRQWEADCGHGASGNSK
ncbi:protein-tyrosine phosphatase-like protein [Mycena latifolia]|nr:protein-tyrosine phosphatase-like protein [Mycena latifolia]